MACIVACLYTVILFEAATAGVALNYIIQIAVEKFSKIAPEDRDFNEAIIFAFWNVVLAGFVVTLPCLCYAVNKRAPKWLYPYMVWRMMLNVLLVAMMAFLCTLWSPKDKQKDVYLVVLTPGAVGILLGVVFFWAAFGAFRQFGRYRIDTVERLMSY